MTDELVDVVIPAHNEEATVADVVSAARAAQCVRRVIVVSDASTDATARRARAAGAEVLEISVRNKGTAMAAGLFAIRSPRVGFLDADLTGLSPLHIEALCAIPEAMVIGRREDCLRLETMPPVGGERVMPIAVARRAELPGAGWGAEIRLHYTAERMGVPIVEIPLAEVTHEPRGRGGDMQWMREIYGAMRDEWDARASRTPR